MTLRFHNTLNQRLEEFRPLVEGKASVYVCGLTTYDLAHAGHARTNTTFDVLVRHLRARGFAVTYVRNVTDVDDKILKRASERGEEPLALSQRMSDLADADLAAIGCGKPDHEPRVSTHIPDIVRLIETLIEKGHAYVAETPKGKDVYFAVRSFADYGKLSHRKIDDLQAGARIEVGDIKRDPLDFALWKGDVPDAWGWSSPWGNGRPGWHIECSAMAERYLGPHFDIHCGGMDLIFPHHENEVAQSEAAHGPTFAHTWLHGGFLNVDSEKMSKSLGNFVTIRDVLERNDAEGFRYFLLGTHYRGPLSFDCEKKENDRVVFPGVDEAERRVEYLYGTWDKLREASAGAEPKSDGSAIGNLFSEAHERLLSALDHDLNAPAALAVLADLAKAANETATQALKQKDPAKKGALAALAALGKSALESSAGTLGLLLTPSDVFFTRTRERRLRIRGLLASAIEEKIAARKKAREDKDFARSDEIRKELLEQGVEILDGQGASTWRVIL